jgi:hypothetical protein
MDDLEVYKKALEIAERENYRVTRTRKRSGVTQYIDFLFTQEYILFQAREELRTEKPLYKMKYGFTVLESGNV